jgi:hypothetical protein
MECRKRDGADCNYLYDVYMGLLAGLSNMLFG